MVEPHGSSLRIVLVDYGLAKCLTPGWPEFTERGAAVGTPGWAPSEQMRGAMPAFSMDIFAAAKVIFLMLTGISPWGEHRNAEVDAIGNGVPGRRYVDTLESHGHLEWKITASLERCLAHAPEKRDDAITLRVCFDKVRKEAARLEAGRPAPIINATAQDGVNLVSTRVEQREIAARVEPTMPQTKKSQPTEIEGGPGWTPRGGGEPVDDSGVTNLPQRTKPMMAARAASNETLAPAIQPSEHEPPQRPTRVRAIALGGLLALGFVFCATAAISFHRSKASAEAIQPPAPPAATSATAETAPMVNVAPTPVAEPVPKPARLDETPTAIPPPAPAPSSPSASIAPSHASAPTAIPTAKRASKSTGNQKDHETGDLDISPGVGKVMPAP